MLEKTRSDVEEFWEVDSLAEVVTAVEDVLAVAGKEVCTILAIKYI